MAEDRENWKIQIVKNTPVVLIALGLLFVGTGAAGGIARLSIIIPGTLPQVVVGCVGTAIILFGCLLIWRGMPENRGTSFEECGFEITSPESGTQVGEEPVDFRGTYKKVAGEHVLLVERSAVTGNYYFRAKVVLVDGKNWAASCHIGGPEGTERIIHVAVVGKSGSALTNIIRRLARKPPKLGPAFLS